MACLGYAVCGDDDVNASMRSEGDEEANRQPLARYLHLRFQAAQASDLGIVGRPQMFDRRAYLGSLRVQRTRTSAVRDRAVELCGQVLRVHVGSQTARQHELKLQFCQLVLLVLRHLTRLIQKLRFFGALRFDEVDVLL